MGVDLKGLYRRGEIRDKDIFALADEIRFAESSIIVPARDRPEILVGVGRSHRGGTWYESYECLREGGYFMLSPHEFVRFLVHINTAPRIYDGNGKVVNNLVRDALVDDVFGRSAPWRAEWLGAKFLDNSVTYYRIMSDGTICEVTEKLDCLMEDKNPGIDLNSWLNSPTVQGLPRKGVEKGGVYYIAPRNGSVARVEAGPIASGLSCDRRAELSGHTVGVRCARVLKR